MAADGSVFSIRKIDSGGLKRQSGVPLVSQPLTGFVYLTGGSLLLESGGFSHLCTPGQLLLIPRGTAFSITYHQDCTGFSGGFAPSLLSDSRALESLGSITVKAFWFDEAAFVGELFNLLMERTDTPVLGRALDLLLELVRLPRGGSPNPLTQRFLNLIFEGEGPTGSARMFRRGCGLTPTAYRKSQATKHEKS